MIWEIKCSGFSDSIIIMIIVVVRSSGSNISELVLKVMHNFCME